MKQALVLGLGAVGKEIAGKLAEENYLVVGTKRKKGQTETTEEEARNKIDIKELDITSTSSTEQFLKNIKDKQFDVLISTMGKPVKLSKFVKEENIPEELNFVAKQIEIIQKIIPFLKKQAQICFILSEVTLDKNQKYLPAYTIGKYALLGAMKVIQNEHTFRCNAISPGMMDTTFVQEIPQIARDMYEKQNGYTDPKTVAQEVIRVINDSTIIGQNIWVK